VFSDTNRKEAMTPFPCPIPTLKYKCRKISLPQSLPLSLSLSLYPTLCHQPVTVTSTCHCIQPIIVILPSTCYTRTCTKSSINCVPTYASMYKPYHNKIMYHVPSITYQESASSQYKKYVPLIKKHNIHKPNTKNMSQHISPQP
jgi:hypothetical protein